MHRKRRHFDAQRNEIYIERFVDMAVELAMENPHASSDLMELMDDVGTNTMTHGKDINIESRSPNELHDQFKTKRIHDSLELFFLHVFIENSADDAWETLHNIPDQRPEFMGIFLQVSALNPKSAIGARAVNWVYGNDYEEAWRHAVDWAKSLTQ